MGHTKEEQQMLTIAPRILFKKVTKKLCIEHEMEKIMNISLFYGFLFNAQGQSLAKPHKKYCNSLGQPFTEFIHNP